MGGKTFIHSTGIDCSCGSCCYFLSLHSTRAKDCRRVTQVERDILPEEPLVRDLRVFLHCNSSFAKLQPQQMASWDCSPSFKLQLGMDFSFFSVSGHSLCRCCLHTSIKVCLPAVAPKMAKILVAIKLC